MEVAQVLTIFAVVATNLITVITLYIHSDNKMNAALKSISDEMKDFHGRLCAIEERRNKLLEK
jgi:hypothetical protein